jgi:predicted phosphohydrolase
LKLVLLSDTRGRHRDVTVPDGDLLIHAGDVTRFSKSALEIEDFCTWLGELPHRRKLIVPGNHDFLGRSLATSQPIIQRTVLIDEEMIIDGIKLYGSPPPSFMEAHSGNHPRGIDGAIGTTYQRT